MKAAKQLTRPFWSIHGRFAVDGAELTKARIAAGLSMDEVATALGCNKSSVSRWEQRKLTPSEERIMKLVDLFGTRSFIIGNASFEKDRRRKIKRHR